MSSTSIQQFQNQDFGNLRTTIDENGNPLFCAKDIATALGYKNTKDAIAKHCRGVAICYPIVDSLGREQSARFITEGDMYRLIASSKLESAVKFESWVFDDVLPSIRKHGMYATPTTIEKMLADPDTMIQTLTALKAERAKAAQLEADKQALVDDNAHMLPKAVAYDSFIDGDGTYSLTSAARLLSQMDKTINRKRLTALLRADEMLCKASRCPTKKAIDRGYAKQMIAKKANGEAADPYAHLTQKGLDWCIRNYVSMPTNKSVPINAQATNA